MTEANAAESANAAMRRYWNEVAGPRWVGRAEVQEARNIEVAELILREARPQPGERVLDIGCGPGATAFPLAAAVGPSGHVTGVDIAEPMLDLLRRRIAERSVANITPLLADAQTYAFPPASFDLLVSRFGVMFFADPYAAFRNLIGALKPGGRLVMAVWAPIAENLHWKIPLDIAIGRLGPPAPADPRAPGPLALSDTDYFREILDRAGFAETTVTPTRFQVIGKSPKDEAELAARMGPPLRLLEEKQADETTRRTLTGEFEAAFDAHAAPNGELRLPGTVLLAKARR
jgi:ubiquinone/menaquinone biosynthesis C-methylase UbiE